MTKNYTKRRKYRHPTITVFIYLEKIKNITLFLSPKDKYVYDIETNIEN